MRSWGKASKLPKELYLGWSYAHLLCCRRWQTLSLYAGSSFDRKCHPFARPVVLFRSCRSCHILIRWVLTMSVTANWADALFRQILVDAACMGRQPSVLFIELHARRPDRPEARLIIPSAVMSWVYHPRYALVFGSTITGF